MRLEKSLGGEDRLEKSFGDEVKSGKIMVGEEEWWMAMFVASASVCRQSTTLGIPLGRLPTIFHR